MASAFSTSGFYQSRNIRGRVSAGSGNNSPTGQGPPHRRHDSSPLGDLPRTEVTNEQILRSIMILNRKVQGLAEANKKQEEAFQQVQDVMGAQICELTEEVRTLQKRLGEEDAAPPAKRQKRAGSVLLSEMVRRLHNSDENEKKYKGEERLNAPHNETVTSFLIKEIAGTSEYTPNAIRAACVSYYETVRRRYLLSRPENAQKSAKQKREKCLRSRRGRLLDARAGVIRTEEEKALWTGVAADFMSDEEDAEVDGIAVWLVKPPSFRAPALTDLCNALQTRLDEDPKYRASHTPRRKEEGVFSTRDPPTKYDPEKASRHLAGAPPADARPPRRRTSTPMSDITNRNPTTTPAPPSRPNPATSVRSLSFQDSMAMEGFNEAREVQQNELDSFDMFEDSMLTEL